MLHNIFATLKSYAWQAVSALLFVALMAAGLSLHLERKDHAETRGDRDRIRLDFSAYVKDQAELNAAASRDARKKEQELQAAADKFRSDAYVQINRLRGERDAAIAGLRNRAQRPTGGANGIGLPAPAGPRAEARSCTGAELYRTDAEFLVWIAARDEELRAEYNKLWDLYQRARSNQDAITDAK